MLHHSVIEGRSRKLRKFFAPVFLESAGTAHHGNESPKFRRVPVKLGENCWHRPDEHAGIPSKISFANEGFGQVDIWFLAKTHNTEETWFSRNCLAHFNVAKTRMGRGRSDPDCDQRALFRRGFYRIANDFLKCRRLLNHMIGRQNNHRGGVITGGDPGYTERDGRGGIAFRWLGNDITRRDILE